MKENLLVNGEAMNASLEGLLAAELFLNDHYLFRRNVLSGKVEFAEKTSGQTADQVSAEPADDAEPADPVFRPLTEMALTNNLLVNLDELEAIRPSQQSSLKQLLSKNKVNGRKIYGDAQTDRPRYASFTATTNNPRPLSDATGSRRYVCVRIPEGLLIDNSGDIDYEQLYAQLVYEVTEQGMPADF